MGTDGKVALVTGANSGFGLACTIAFARRGYRAVGTVRSPAKAAAVRRAAQDAGVEVDTALLDVTDAPACRRVVDRYRPYVLVNNAGFGATGAVEDVDDEEARAALETMVLAPARLARLALAHMRADGGGRIINISSIYGRTSTPLTGWYQAAKHALEAVSDALRVEVAGAGVKVILVEPGGFRTGIWDGAEGALHQREGSRYSAAYRRTVAGLRLAQPMMGDPADVARVVVAAAGARMPRARYLVGYDAQAAAVVDRLTPTPVKDRVTRLLLGL